MKNNKKSKEYQKGYEDGVNDCHRLIKDRIVISVSSLQMELAQILDTIHDTDKKVLMRFFNNIK